MEKSIHPRNNLKNKSKNKQEKSKVFEKNRNYQIKLKNSSTCYN